MQAVQRSAELDRILRLPRRIEIVDDAFVDAITTHLSRTPGVRLRPIQAQALSEAHDYGGFFGQLRVGAGKTLLSYLLPTILGSKKSILFVPAMLKGKTVREFAKLSKDWKGTAPMIESYEMLSRDRGGKLLNLVDWDLVMFDECHSLKNPKGGRARKVRELMKRRRAAGTPPQVCAFSGTITKRSLRDFAHIIEWCLPKLCPLPTHYRELSEWANAIDEKVQDANRMAPGALTVFCCAEDLKSDDLTAVRKGVGRRMFETPGVVRTTDPGISCSLIVQGVEVHAPASIEKAFDDLRTKWETPDGWTFSDAVTLWRHARELACGFFYRWDPRPPEPWRDARRKWHSAAREAIEHNHSGIDTEYDVAMACYRLMQGEEKTRSETMGAAVEAYRAWKPIEPTFRPNPVPVWIDDFAVDYAIKWAKQNHGIIWVEHRAFGQRLAQKSGLRYFAEGGKDALGPIEDADPKSTIIASIASNGKGRNLQAFNRSLVVSCTPTGVIWEQMLGRLHRDGQEADEVVFDVMFSCKEQLAGFERAKNDCIFHKDFLATPMKLTYADIILPTVTTAGFAWQ